MRKKSRKIYVASSWRNEHQPAVVEVLLRLGHEVYDFRRPPGKQTGFHWSDIDPAWKRWNANEYREAPQHPIAEAGFSSDEDGLEWCDTCLLVQPCGTSAHLELGVAVGSGKTTVIYFPDGVAVEPELMAAFADAILVGTNELSEAFTL